MNSITACGGAALNVIRGSNRPASVSVCGGFPATGVIGRQRSVLSLGGEETGASAPKQDALRSR